MEYEIEFEDLSSSFEVGLCKYKNSCQDLLMPLHLPDSKFYDLLEERDGELWEDKELVEKLVERLGTAHGPYRRKVKSLDRKIKLFCSKLRLDQVTMKVGLQLHLRFLPCCTDTAC
jgi:hypothetical protein